MDDVIIYLNGEPVKAEKGEMIIDVARRNGIDVPHFCWNKRLERIGACRICVVEVEGHERLVASCSTPVAEGMKVKTHTPRVLEARRINLELLLANHDLNCTACRMNLDCRLQEYANDFMIEEVMFSGKKRHEEIDYSSTSIVRDNNKCILCEQCVQVCNKIQTVYAIGLQRRGFNTRVHPPLDMSMAESPCVNCGQCVVACPTGALHEKSSIKDVIEALNSDKYLIAQTAPSIRATLGECFGMPAGTPVTGRMVSALRDLGFHKIFDTDFAADITIVEEATEFVKRFRENRDLPMITTCCPAWIKFAEQYYFNELNHMSSCRSPQAILASLVKTYYAERIGKDPKDICLIDIMPCTAKKFEIQRPEFAGDADYVLTTVELAKIIKQYSIDFENIPSSAFDNPMGTASGAGDIFGKTGGVMEAALRTVADMMAGEDLTRFDYTVVRGMETMKEAELEIAGEKIRVCAVHTLGEARKLLEQIKGGKSPYQFIEIMACYGGCVGGGGQPPPHRKEILEKRAQALVKEDTGKGLRKSHQNPDVLRLYKEYLGEFGGARAHQLLHTSYTNRCIIDKCR
ncbi:MAG TPA: 2Fe-2S iron-sulfur cluster binding domain-containing protein [Candidatus Altiarchaeales archaeon]|nr:2Fe-2S iron-sulfur cluster binding domain-containing protein [Candidatus Altiarchaeales archaeon]